MREQAIGDGVQVEKVLEDLIQRLSGRDTTPAVKAALIEARRLKNVTNRWGAIPPPPDARREMMTRVMELVASAGGSGALSMPPPAPAVPPESRGKPREAPPTSDPLPRSSPSTQRSVPVELDSVSLGTPSPLSDPQPSKDPRSARPGAASPAEPRPAARNTSPAVRRSQPPHLVHPTSRGGRPATLPGFKPLGTAADEAEARVQAEAARRERAKFSTEPPPAHNVPPPAPVDPFLDGEEVGFGSSTRGRTLNLGSKGITDALEALADAKVPPPPKFEDPPTNQEPSTSRRSTQAISSLSVGAAAPPPRASAPTSAVSQSLARAVVAPGITIVRPDAAQWQPHPRAKGVTMKILHRDPEAGTFTAILRFAPGATLPRRKHKAAEEMLLTVGLAKIGSHDLRTGQYCRADAETEHEPITSASGCTFFVSSSESDELPGDA